MLAAKTEIPLSEIRERMRMAFRAEALDVLPELDAALLAMELEPQNIALVNRVFRAMHTIKGSGATAGFVHLAHFAHEVEEAFDLARSNKLAVTSELIDCGLKACDVIREMLNLDDEEREVIGERAVTSALSHLVPGKSSTAPQEPSPIAPAEQTLCAYQISFHPHASLFRSGTDPLSLLDELRDLGTARITAHLSGLPSLDSLDPEGCYLRWEILLLADCGEAAIRDVFLFVEDDCRIDLSLAPDQRECVAFLLLPRQQQHDALCHAAGACIATSAGESAPHLRTLLVAARCEQRTDVVEAVLWQMRILGRIARVGRPASQQDKHRLAVAMQPVHLASRNHPRRETHPCV